MKHQQLKIDILDPKVKGILSELENLGLIKIQDDDIQIKKKRIAEKLEGKDLLSMDEDELNKIIKNR